jgi:outer membrane protein OmpA-like peptidoglycan-associated protein
MKKKRSIFLIGVLCLMGFNTLSYGAEGVTERAVLTTIYFSNGSADLGSESENELKKVQSVLEADPAIGLQIEGHGDQVGFAETKR